MKIIAALVAGGILTSASVNMMDEVTKPASDMVGKTSISTVVRAAQPAFLLGNQDWPGALEGALDDLTQGAEFLTVNGTVIRWANEYTCLEADVPDVWSRVETTECEVTD